MSLRGKQWDSRPTPTADTYKHYNRRHGGSDEMALV